LTQEASELDQDAMKVFQEVWSSSICQALKQISGEDFEVRVVDSIPISGSDESAGVWVRFSASAGMAGEIGFFVSEPDALLLSGLLTGQAPERSAEPAGDFREAVAEVFRQFVGAASTALKSKAKGEFELAFSGFEPPSWKAAFGCCLEVRGPKGRLIQVSLIADQGLVKSAIATLAPSEISPSASEPGKVTASPAPAVQGKENIGLLLDIELEAALRFGEREMLLREILDLNSGSVIELNRRVDEPVELLVCGKVVAKGDVVVLDGNYALRVTQVGSAADRMSTLRI